MEIKHVEVELRYTGGSARAQMSLDDVAALVKLADSLRGLVPQQRAVGSGADCKTAEGIREMREKGFQVPEYMRWRADCAYCNPTPAA